MVEINKKDTTIPHLVNGKFGAAKVILKPAAKGHGLVAGKAMRAVLEAAGIRDISAKSFGSNNQTNVVKATFAALGKLRSVREPS
jgi:small subunit ribosomal protein S5